jgi:hypothetical protein|nr:MAG TPA: hypothetical protein [Caudoviricetes sp.]
MAEKIVFGADIDNVTIKNIDGKLTAIVDVENAEDEFEVVTDYVEPQEDDDYYVESVFAKFRHKATQLMTDAFKKEKKPRSAPVNENLVDPITTDVTVEGTTIKVVPHNIYNKSAIDGYDVSLGTLDGFDQVEFSKSDYPNAKAFNEAHAGKTFKVTTFQRFAKAGGHPLVKPTEFQVAYPTLPYLEGTAKVDMEHSAYLIVAELRYSAIATTNPEVNSNPAFYNDLQNAISNLDVSNIKMRYELLTSEGNTLTGEVNVDTDTYRYNIGNLTVARNNVPDYINHTIKHEKWTLDPITVEGFYTKFQITFEPYEDTNNF